MIWNPSEGINIGFFTIRYYSLMFVIAFGLGWYIMKHIFKKENEPIEKLDTLFIWTVVATLVGARLGHVFFYDWEYYRNNLLEILLPFRFNPEFEFTGFQGLASHGAAVAIIITMYFYSTKVIKRPILWVLDRVVIPVACGAIFVRIGNFFNSEIYGHITSKDNFYGVKFIREEEFWKSNSLSQITNTTNQNEGYNLIQNDPKFADILNQIPYRHPAQLYEAGLYIFVFLILFFLYWKTKTAEKQGLLFGYFLILLWSVRFVVEYVKVSQGGIEETFGLFSTGQWLSIPFILVGIYYVFVAEKPVVDTI
jgi:phosphatidylglycerol---prolipoprotein diacylglyceryl transferase